MNRKILFVVTLFIFATSVNAENIVNVTSCTGLFGSDTTYVLQNDISGGSFGCLSLGGHDNIINLNGFTVSGSVPISTGSSCDYTDIINGRVIGSIGMEFDEGSKCRIINVSIEASDYGIFYPGGYYTSGWLENVEIKNATIAISATGTPSGNIFLRNVTMTRDNSGVAFEIAGFDDSLITLENSKVTNFVFSFRPDPTTWSQDWLIKNTDINLTTIDASSIYGKMRFFKENLIIINVTNQTGQGIPATIEISDSGQFYRTTNEEVLYHRGNVNPTGFVTAATDKNGLAEVFLTEQLITVDSAININVTVLNPYDFTVRSSDQTNTTYNVTADSGLVLNFTLNIPTDGTGTLQNCTISQMLDLNNDGSVNLRDAAIIIAKFFNRNVTVSGTKECNALNFQPLLVD